MNKELLQDKLTAMVMANCLKAAREGFYDLGEEYAPGFAHWFYNACKLIVRLAAIMKTLNGDGVGYPNVKFGYDPLTSSLNRAMIKV